MKIHINAQFLKKYSPTFSLVGDTHSNCRIFKKYSRLDTLPNIMLYHSQVTVLNAPYKALEALVQNSLHNTSIVNKDITKYST